MGCIAGLATRWFVANRRMVADDGVVTTTGVSASMPMMLTLIEAIAGRDKAEAVARNLGVATWDARHASGAFRFAISLALSLKRDRSSSSVGFAPSARRRKKASQALRTDAFQTSRT